MLPISKRLLLLPVLALLPTLIHCSGGSQPIAPAGDGGPSGDATTGDGGPTSYYDNEQDKPLVPANKVDLLFVVDNSASMGDKQVMLTTSIGRVLRRLIEPSADHAPIGDIHVGVISSSLGNLGGNVCDSVNPRTNDRAHLLNKARGSETAVVPGAEKGFLSYGPGQITDVAALEKAATDLVVGVDQTGCGLEAQLESMYRFLAQPDPPLSVVTDTGVARYEGIDEELLAQRSAFLRPDSAIAVVMITDEDDSNVDPMAVKGQGWAFTMKEFPGSKIFRGNPKQGTTAPRGTSSCEATPNAENCQSCGIGCLPGDAACAVAKEDAQCKQTGTVGQQGVGYDGFFPSTDDELNVRFHRMKQRFGVDPQFPIERYVRALTNRKIPDRGAEHPEVDGKPGPYVHAPKCTNPLFAAAPLPSNKSAELCNLTEGTRSRELVFFGLIGGVPNQLLPGGQPEWTKILGANPDAYDFTGIDPHMIQSPTPRAGLPGPAARGDNGTDPVHGREWETSKTDLQYACTFALPDNMKRECTSNDSSCDCTPDDVRNPPLCAGTSTQVRAKSYPTPRELRVAKGLGNRAIVGSICPADPMVGYAPTLDAIAARISSSLVK